MLIPLSTIIYSYFLRKIYSLLRSNHFTTTDPDNKYERNETLSPTNPYTFVPIRGYNRTLGSIDRVTIDSRSIPR